MQLHILRMLCLSTLAIATGAVVTGIPVKASPQTIAQAEPTVTFYCGQALDPSSKSNLPATLVKVGDVTEEPVVIIWKSEAFKSTPQQRCEIVSPKFQAALQQGRNYLTSGIDKKTGLGMICAANELEQPCTRSSMLFTLKSYQDAGTTLEELSSVLAGTASIPLYQSGGNRVVNLRDFSLLRKNKK